MKHREGGGKVTDFKCFSSSDALLSLTSLNYKIIRNPDSGRCLIKTPNLPNLYIIRDLVEALRGVFTTLPWYPGLCGLEQLPSYTRKVDFRRYSTFGILLEHLLGLLQYAVCALCHLAVEITRTVLRGSKSWFLSHFPCPGDLESSW